MPSVATGQTHFTNDGEKAMLGAIFKGTSIAPLKIGLFSANSATNSKDSDAVVLGDLTVLPTTGSAHPGYNTISLVGANWYTSGGGGVTGTAVYAGTTTGTTAMTLEFTNTSTGGQNWETLPIGFYVTTGTGTAETLVFYQQESGALNMTPGSKYQVTLSVTLE